METATKPAGTVEIESEVSGHLPAPEAPVDITVVAGEARDMPAELLFQGWRAGHELVAEAFIDDGETAGGRRVWPVAG